jgi:hypothetical protein
MAAKSRYQCRNCKTPGGFEIMLTCRHAIVLAAIAVLAGCVSPPPGGRPASKVAYITSGDTYFYGATRHAQEISVLELDGAAVAAPADPLVLQPGRHVLKLKCGDNQSTQTINVRAGEIYQYAMRTAPSGKGCEATLMRVRGTF